MARRRRITAADSRIIRRLIIKQGVSIREALRRFRQTGRSIGDRLFSTIAGALLSGFRGNLNQVTVSGSRAARERLGRDLGDVLANARFRVTATGFASGTAAVSIENRTFDVPWFTSRVTVVFNIVQNEVGLLPTIAAQKILIASRGLQYQAALRALRSQSSGLAQAAEQYGRVSVGDDIQGNVTSITPEQIQ